MALHEDKVELLRKSEIFSQLREYELDIISKYSEFINCKKGQAIFGQGKRARSLYVVEKGRVGIIGVDSGNVTIAQIVAGESFGEMDFLGMSERSAGAFAEEDTVVLRFPSRGYDSETIFRDHAYVSARMLQRLLGIISERIWNVNKLLFDKTGWLQDLHRQLLCDKMTGLYNQNFLKEDFINILPDLGKSAALLMIKPDNFKDINDGFGHEAGDQVLNLIAIFLQSELGENDIGIRYGGDEFAAILTDTGMDNAVKRAEEIQAAIGSINISGITGPDGPGIPTSIGIAVYPDHGEDSEILLKKAYGNLFKARDKGGSIVI
ncbi:MAG: GGDEF domain-containing protein [Spirochaetes bacterium]|jgi:diguanylate cyclase (GGDEF)-like protein|nr:GGDEF domain-containing protein [Spirochaetota bacterium]